MREGYRLQWVAIIPAIGVPRVRGGYRNKLERQSGLCSPHARGVSGGVFFAELI